MFTKHSEHFLFSKWSFYLQLPGYVFFSLILFVFVEEGWPIRCREVATTINVNYWGTSSPAGRNYLPGLNQKELMLSLLFCLRLSLLLLLLTRYIMIS